MPCDLKLLEGVSWIDEAEFRNSVAASLNARVSADSVDDRAMLERAWDDFQRSERVVEDLNRMVEEARFVALRRENCGFDMASHSSPSGVSTELRRVSGGYKDVSVALNSARADMAKKEEALRRVQLEVEAREKERLEVARRRVRDEWERENREEQNLRHVVPLGHSPDVADSLVKGFVSSSQRLSSVPGTAVGALLGQNVTVFKPERVATPRAHFESRDGRRGRQSHLHGIPLKEYSGGTVLPSINRVCVSRADIRAKHMRYEDDADIHVFAARQERRRRLEAAEAILEERQLRRRCEVNDSINETGSCFTAASCGSQTVKQEKCARLVPPAESSEEKQPRTVVSSGAVEVIDVDALMENPSDVSGVILAEVLRLKESDAPERIVAGDCDAAAVVQRMGNTSSSHEPQTSVAMQLPTEVEVTLLPGICLSETIYHRLFDYQQVGLRWLAHLHAQRAGGILGDEMGLGKTIQIAAFVNALHHSHQLRGPVLIVAPMTVLRQWVAEMHRWAPYVRTCVMHDSSSARLSREDLMASVLGTPSVVVTTYAALRLHCTTLHTGGFQYIILDEGHKISNPDASVTLAAKSFPTPHRLILSGSPIQNTLKELWCLFDFVRPGLLGSMHKFIEEFEEPINASTSVRAPPLVLATAVECAKTLQTQIAPFLLRRLKRHVNIALPDRFERIIRVPLSDQQLEQYVELLTSPAVQRLFSRNLYQPLLSGRLNSDARDASGSLHVAGKQFQVMAGQCESSGLHLEAFRVLNQLRQICNHADIFSVYRGEEIEKDRQLAAMPSLRSCATGSVMHARCFRSNNPVNLGGSAKLSVLKEMLCEWKKHGHRALIFSQTRMLLDIIENLCEQENYRYVRMDGTTHGHHRQELMDRFNEDEQIFVALLTTRVGGVGLNLIGADRVVIFDPDWNPVTDEQARERAWRIGQTREVCVYRLITSGTVEETILRRQLAKRYVTDKVLKDPTLQRFFHVHEYLTESFFLGAEYDARVPPGKKHVLATFVRERDMQALDKDWCELPEDGTDKETFDDSSGRPTNCKVDDEAPGEAELKVEEKVFGTLVRVPHLGQKPPDHETATIDCMKKEKAPAIADQRKAETNLLQTLADGHEVSVSGRDRVAQRLARARAEQTLLRVTNHTTRSVMEQQRDFSLMWSAKAMARRRKTGSGP